MWYSSNNTDNTTGSTFEGSPEWHILGHLDILTYSLNKGHNYYVQGIYSTLNWNFLLHGKPPHWKQTVVSRYDLINII